MIPGGLRGLAIGVLVAAGYASAVGSHTPAPHSAVTRGALAQFGTAQSEKTSRVAGLTTSLDEILREPAFERASVGLVVRSLATDETLYRLNGSTWLVPASTQKILTVVAAAARLGWNYRFETRLVSTGPIVDGTLEGDLVVVGHGDPSINPRHPGRVDAFDQWALALKAQGIRHVAGHIVGDDDAIDEPGWGVGWAWDDLVEGYGSAYGALQFHENEVEIIVGPGMTPGAPAIVALSPANHGLLVENLAVTVAAGAGPMLRLAREPATRFLRVDGRAPLGSAPRSARAGVDNPTLFFASELRATLMRHGILVDGAAADIDELSPAPDTSAGETLLVDLSPPLSEVVDPLLKWSRNGYAETLLMALDPTLPAEMGEALDVLGATLESLGVAADSYSTLDGSGLSRNDYLSADALVATLTAAWRSDSLRDPFVAAMPEAGRSGALVGRLVGTPAEGRVRAKTGSMSNVRTLAGYVDTIAGEPLVFAFLCNGFDVRQREIDAQMDAALLALVALPRVPK